MATPPKRPVRQLLLRRYTDLPALIDILARRQITLLSPSTWDDQNDKRAAQRLGRPEDLADGRLPKSPYERNLCRIAFLAPDIQAAILAGKQPCDLTLTRLLQNDIPPLWEDQRRVFGFPC